IVGGLESSPDSIIHTMCVMPACHCCPNVLLFCVSPMLVRPRPGTALSPRASVVLRACRRGGVL
ncbi:MAG: hypothetical protein ACPIOQ_75110, partial [Promethearchaeia archaeon]